MRQNLNLLMNLVGASNIYVDESCRCLQSLCCDAAVNQDDDSVRVDVAIDREFKNPWASTGEYCCGLLVQQIIKYQLVADEDID